MRSEEQKRGDRQMGVGGGSGAGMFALFRLFPLRGAQGLEDVGKYHLGSILWVAEKKLWWVICP